MNTRPSKSPRKLINECGVSVRKLATLAGCNKSTITRVKKTNVWPVQERVREGLKSALAELAANNA